LPRIRYDSRYMNKRKIDLVHAGKFGKSEKSGESPKSFLSWFLKTKNIVF